MVWILSIVRIAESQLYPRGLKLQRFDKVSYIPGYFFFVLIIGKSIFESNTKNYAFGLSIQASGLITKISTVGEKMTGVYIKWRKAQSESGTKFDKVFYHYQHDDEKIFVRPGLL